MIPLSHEMAGDLLAALALDAVDAAERTALEDHVSMCRRCRAELSGYLEALSALVPDEPAPPAVWERIEAAIAPGGAPARPTAPVVPLRPTRRPGLRAVAVAACLAAVAAAAGFGAGRWWSPDAATLEAVADAARAETGATAATLQSADGTRVATVVLLADGTGYVMDLALPALPPDRTYQLWEVTQGGVISAGVLGNAPRVSSFQAVANVTGLVLTEEVAGGVPQSEGVVVASWEAPSL